MKRRELAKALLAAPLVLRMPQAFGQAYPDRPIRLIVSYAPGAHSDAIARLIARALGDALKTSVVVENRSGANGTIGLATAAGSPADGYTIALVASGNLLLAPLLDAGVRYDAQRDFVALARISRAPMVLAARADLPVQGLPQLIEHARRQPGRLTYASTGNVARMALESLQASAGIDILAVPYRGTSPALLDVVAGRVDLLFADVASVGPQVGAGTLRLLAGTDASRSRRFPELPTAVEQGVDFVWEAWQGIAAPAGTPGEIVRQLRAALLQARASAEFREGLDQLGFEPIDEAAEDFPVVIRKETERFRALVARLGPQIGRP